jgi:hypothetical protein
MLRYCGVQLEIADAIGLVASALLCYGLRGVDQRTKIEKGHCLELGKRPRCPLHRVAFHILALKR